MNKNLLTLLIFIGILWWGVIFLFFSISQYSNIITFNQWIILFIFSLLWILLGIIWNSKDHNTKYLKKIIIILEIYLLGLVLIQPYINFSQGEFATLILSGVALFQLSNKKNTKNRILSFLVFLIILQLLATSFLMIYRSSLSRDSINLLDFPSIKIITKESLNTDKWYFEIIDQDLTSKKRYYFSTQWEQTIHLSKDGNYHFIFALQYYSDLFQVFLLHPQGEILQFFPQSEIKITTTPSSFISQDQKGRVDHYQLFNTSNNPTIKQLQESFEYDNTKNLLWDLPNYLFNNPKIAKMSKYFTKYLAQIYPFFYQKNWKYFLEYEEYLTIEESNTKNKISPTSEGIKNHFNLGKSFINLKKFKEYF